MLLIIRMYALIGILFGFLFVLITIGGEIIGIGNVFVYGFLALSLLMIQFAIGPKIVEWNMHIQYVTIEQQPELHKMVGELAKKAGIAKPRIGIAETSVPNAFAFGRTRSDSRICVTRGILNLLDKKELEAVLGHEFSHITHRDVAIITLISAIPTIAWYLGWSLIHRRDRESGSFAAVGVFAFAVYIVTNFLVLYGSRIREYAADEGSIRLGHEPSTLASALYKLVYGSARASADEIARLQGMKAFFLSDPGKSRKEFSDLKVLDADLSGNIDASELRAVRNRKITIGYTNSFFELFSTHPNMLKRIGKLSQYTIK